MEELKCFEKSTTILRGSFISYESYGTFRRALWISELKILQISWKKNLRMEIKKIYMLMESLYRKKKN